MGVRVGRGERDLRPIVVEMGVQKYALGSVMFAMGDTRVLCAATVEESVPPFLKGKVRGGSQPSTGCFQPPPRLGRPGRPTAAEPWRSSGS
jgi:ribonuclease PH